jgi:hypothetical protein
MVLAEYHDFLVASTQASAALIGLLFVAITLAPDRVFGSQAEAGRQARALSAFTAMANILFISFASLIPGIPIGPVVVGIAAVAVLQTLGLLPLLMSWRAEGVLWRSLLLLLGSFAIYGGEIAVGIQLWQGPPDTGSLTGLLELLLGAYAIGLGRAWELLGAPRTGLLSRLLARLDREPKPPPPKS